MKRFFTVRYFPVFATLPIPWSAAIFSAAFLAFSPAHADDWQGLHLEAGGGFVLPRGDSSEYLNRGYRVGVGTELGLVDNLGVLLSLAYDRYDVNADKLKSDMGLPPAARLDGEIEVYALNFSPKLYLLQKDIAAYFIGGGGPNWVRRKGHRPVPGGGTLSRNRLDRGWGSQLGFGVDVMASEYFRVGLAPTYNFGRAGGRKTSYAALLLYVRI